MRGWKADKQLVMADDGGQELIVLLGAAALEAQLWLAAEWGTVVSLSLG